MEISLYRLQVVRVQRSYIERIVIAWMWCMFLGGYGATLHAQTQNESAIIRSDSIHNPVIGRFGMVASQQILATKVGADILRRGGNAVDAAVATAMALAVVLPRAGNLGGGGFMLVYLAKKNKTIALDYREMAPALATRTMFLDQAGNVEGKREKYSHQSAGVPGTVAGMAYALKRYGTMDWRTILQPAIALARDGFAVPWSMASNLERRRKRLTANAETAHTYFKKNGVPYRAGEIIKQKDLARTLALLAKKGSAAFYRGTIAQMIVADMKANGGLIRMRDLKNYRVRERSAISTHYRGYRVVSMPPPSSGGVHIAQMLNVLTQFPVKEMGYGSAQTVHLLSEVMKRAYADRSEYLGDPDFFSVPIARLTARKYALNLAKEISLSKATPANKIKPGQLLPPTESRETTHFSVMDKDGNAVANTYTLNFSFGSGITVPGTGILLNNEMADFAAKPGVPNAFGLLGGDANAIAPQKRPLSSMTPTMIFKNEKPWLILGSPGGSRIITTVLQVVVNVIDHGMNIAQAVHSPRIHHQWLPDKLQLEEGFSPDTIALLRQKGHQVEHTFPMGSVHAIMWRNGLFFGTSDSRRPGAGTIGLMRIPQR